MRRKEMNMDLYPDEDVPPTPKWSWCATSYPTRMILSSLTVAGRAGGMLQPLKGIRISYTRVRGGGRRNGQTNECRTLKTMTTIHCRH